MIGARTTLVGGPGGGRSARHVHGLTLALANNCCPHHYLAVAIQFLDCGTKHLAGWREQLYRVAVRITYENLPGPIRSLLFRRESSAHDFQMTFPRIEVIHAQSEMIVAIGWRKRSAMMSDEV